VVIVGASVSVILLSLLAIGSWLLAKSQPLIAIC
jgi:hypothetical protein